MPTWRRASACSARTRPACTWRPPRRLRASASCVSREYRSRSARCARLSIAVPCRCSSEAPVVGSAPLPAGTERSMPAASETAATRPRKPGVTPRTGADRTTGPTQVSYFVRRNFRQLCPVCGLIFGCDRPIPLLASRTCDVPGPLRCACCERPRRPQVRSLKRQATAFVLAASAALLTAGAATATPGVAAKQAQAKQVLGEIQQIDSSMERAVEAWNRATARLAGTKRELRFNREALHVARTNLAHAQKALAARMVAVYTSNEDQSTLSVLLGATSLNDMINRLETVHTISRQDTHVILEVKTAKVQIARHERQLEHARAVQTQAVATRAAEKARIVRQLAERKALLATIKDQIAHLYAMEHARQLALAAQARNRLATEPAAQQPIDGVGVSAATPDG